MSKIADIVTLINSNFESTTLSSKRFQRGVFNGLAELIKREGVTIPLILNNNGEGTEVELNDTFPFQIYHRITGIEPSEADEYGDGIQIKETTNLKLVCFANRQIMQFDLDDLITAINVGFLTHLSNAQTATLGNWFSNIDIEITGINIDKSSVWSGEFGSEDNLPPYYQCFSIDYSVLSDINTECFALC